MFITIITCIIHTNFQFHSAARETQNEKIRGFLAALRTDLLQRVIGRKTFFCDKT